jgi:hypothetical protein
MLMMEPQTTPYPRWLQRLVELLIVILFVTWVFLGVVLFVEVSFAQAAIGFVVVSIFWGLVGAELAAALKRLWPQTSSIGGMSIRVSKQHLSCY